MPHPLLTRKDRKRTLLWGLLGVFNAPLAFVPVLLHQLNRKAAGRHPPGHAGQAGSAQAPGHTRLDDHQPLTLLCRRMAQGVGLDVLSIYVNEEVDYHNASVDIWPDGEVVLYFEGNPLDEPDGAAMAEAVIGHELAHALRDPNRFQDTARMTGAVYGMILGALAMGAVEGAVLPFYPILVPALLAGIAALPGLRRVFSRNEEFMADLQGVEISGDARKAVLDLALLYNRNNRNPASLMPENSWLENACSVVYGSTHPSYEKRADALRIVFNLQAPLPVLEKIPDPVEEPESPAERFARSIAHEQMYWL